jgi:hypothetical protein
MHLIAMPRIARVAAQARRLWADGSGLSMMEFALGAPLLMAMGGYGAEVSNLAITNMRVSQYALQIADNASRIGVNSGLATYTVTESDINDQLQGLRLFGANAGLTTHGRVTLSSLETIKQGWDTNPTPVQRIHWQRCIGQMSGVDYESHYGTTNKTAGTVADAAHQGTDATTGMGDTTPTVNAPAGSAVMFVEINYQYQPLFGTLFVAPTKLHYVAAAIVRDKRAFDQIGTNSGAASTCDLHTT